MNEYDYCTQASNNNLSAPISTSVKIDMHCKYFLNLFLSKLFNVRSLTFVHSSEMEAHSARP